MIEDQKRSLIDQGQHISRATCTLSFYDWAQTAMKRRTAASPETRRLLKRGLIDGDVGAVERMELESHHKVISMHS